RRDFRNDATIGGVVVELRPHDIRKDSGFPVFIAPHDGGCGFVAACLDAEDSESGFTMLTTLKEIFIARVLLHDPGRIPSRVSKCYIFRRDTASVASWIGPPKRLSDCAKFQLSEENHDQTPSRKCNPYRNPWKRSGSCANKRGVRSP